MDRIFWMCSNVEFEIELALVKSFRAVSIIKPFNVISVRESEMTTYAEEIHERGGEVFVLLGSMPDGKDVFYPYFDKHGGGRMWRKVGEVDGRNLLVMGLFSKE